MRRTSAALLLGVAVFGGAAGWLLQVGLASTGSSVFIPPVTTWSVLFIIAVVVGVLGWSVRRSVHGDPDRPRRRIDPFYAMRVLMLAKASSITGALGLGLGVSLVLYTVSRTGSTGTPAFWPSALLAAGAGAMLVAGLLAESWCRIPPEDQAPLDRAGAEAR